MCNLSILSIFIFPLHACLSPLTFNGPLQCLYLKKPVYIQRFYFTDHPLLGRLHHDIFLFLVDYSLPVFLSHVSEKNLICCVQAKMGNTVLEKPSLVLLLC